MAQNFRMLNDRAFQGDGDPASGDALAISVSSFPLGTIYINNNTGKVWVRDTANGDVNDWVSSAGGNTLYTADSHIFIGVVEYADNAAAITGGLATGAIYRTGDLLKIVH